MKRNRSSSVKQPLQKRAKTVPMRPELKHYTVGLNLTALDTPPSSTNPALYHVTSLVNMGSGDGQSERSGVKIQPKLIKLRVKCAVDPNSDASNANVVADAHTFRVVLYLDKSPNGGSSNWDVIFDTNPSNSGQEYDYQNVWYQRRRYVTLVDKFVTVPASYVVHDGSTFHSYGNHKFFEVTIPLDFETYYSDGTSNVSAIQSGNLGMFVTADASSTSYTKMKFSYRSTLRYQDF